MAGNFGTLIARTIMKFEADTSDLKAGLKNVQGAEKEALQQTIATTEARNKSYDKWAQSIIAVNYAMRLGAKTVEYATDAWHAFEKQADAAGGSQAQAAQKMRGAIDEWGTAMDRAKVSIGALVAQMAPLISTLARVAEGVQNVIDKRNQIGGQVSSSSLPGLGRAFDFAKNVASPLSYAEWGLDKLSGLDNSDMMNRYGTSYVAAAQSSFEAQGAQEHVRMVQAYMRGFAGFDAVEAVLRPMEQQAKMDAQLAWRGFGNSFVSGLTAGASDLSPDERANIAASAQMARTSAMQEFGMDFIGGFGISPEQLKRAQTAVRGGGGPRRPYVGPTSTVEERGGAFLYGTYGALHPPITFSDTLGQAHGDNSSAWLDQSFGWSPGGRQDSAAVMLQRLFAGAGDLQRAGAKLADSRRNTMLAQIFGPISEFKIYQQAFGALTTAVGSAFDAMVTGSMSAGKAVKLAIADGLMGLGKDAAVRALMETAYGFGALAIGGPFAGASAAAHFKSAAMFGLGAVAAGVAAHELGAGGGGGGGAASAGSAPNVSGGGGSGTGGQHTYNIFLGDYFSDSNPRAQDQRISRAIRRVQGDVSGGGVRR